MVRSRLAFVIVILCLYAVVLAACDLLTNATAEPLVPLPTYGTRAATITGTPPTARPEATRKPSPTFDPDFWSNGNWISGWYWIRDEAYKNGANWLVTIPQGTGDIKLRLTVLATEKASGGRGAKAVFFLTWGQAGGTQTDGLAYGRRRIELPNTSPASDPVGYTCTGIVTLTRAEIRDAARLWLKASRQDPLGELPPSTVHVAFNKQSIEVLR